MSGCLVLMLCTVECTPLHNNNIISNIKMIKSILQKGEGEGAEEENIRRNKQTIYLSLLLPNPPQLAPATSSPQH